MIDIDRWKRAWTAHLAKEQAAGWGERCVPQCTAPIATEYERLLESEQDLVGSLVGRVDSSDDAPSPLVKGG